MSNLPSINSSSAESIVVKGFISPEDINGILTEKWLEINRRLTPPKSVTMAPHISTETGHTIFLFSIRSNVVNSDDLDLHQHLLNQASAAFQDVLDKYLLDRELIDSGRPV